MPSRDRLKFCQSISARTMYVCILNHDGEMMLHRNMKASPETFLKRVVT